MSSHEALLANIASLQIGLPGFYVYLTAWIFPGWDVPTVFLISLIPVTAHAIVVSIMTSQFPRSGGEYAWGSRIIPPWLMVAPQIGTLVLSSLLVPGFLDWSIYGGFGTILAGLSMISNNMSLMNTAAALANPNVRFAIIMTFIVLSTLCLVVRFTWVRMWISFWAIVGIVTGLLAGFTLLFSSHATFVSLWNLHMSQYGLSYDQVIATAASGGYSYVPIGAGTFGAFFAILAGTYEMNIGYAGSISFAGEIKSARRGIPYSVLTCVYLGALVLFIMVWGITHVIGQQFVYSAMYLTYSRPDLWKAPFTADPFLFATIATGLNPILIVLVPFGLISGAFGVIPVTALINSRYFLAYSFDRFMPTTISRVDKKYHAPWVALIVVFIVLTCGALFTDYWAAGVVYIGLPWRSMSMLNVLFTVAAALLFPLLAKELYDRSDIVKRWKYVLVICCLVCIGFFGFAIPYVLSHPEYGGPSNPEIAAFYICIFLAGPIIWFASKIYWKRRGLDISLVYKEIAPE